MTNHTEWTDQLSDYLDGELEPAEHAAVDAHLAACSECNRTLNELRRVVLAAQSAPDQQPDTDLWAGISSQITATASPAPRIVEMSRRRFSFTVSQLAAAAVLLIAVSGWLTFRLMARSDAVAQVASDDSTTGHDPFDRVPVADLAAARMDDAGYDAAVADFKATLDENRGRLDPATVKVVEEDLAIIDQAVDEARRALAQDPANDYLTEHLVETRRRKLDVLRHAVLSAGLN
jgi:hypothetical protein